MSEYWVNIGDSDILMVTANSLAELEKKIDDEGEFTSSMINSVVKVGSEHYLQGKWWKNRYTIK